MRFPTLPTLIRTFTLTNITATSLLSSSSSSSSSSTTHRVIKNPSFLTTIHRLLFLQPPPPPPTPRTTTSTLLLKSMPSIPFLGSLFSSSAKKSNDNMTDSSYPVQKTSDEWRAVLSPEQFRVLRNKGTEAPYTGEYDKHMPEQGVYTCAACSAPLYRATHKFKSGCGWPAYFDSIPGAVTRHVDSSLGMARTEIVCSNCGGHLGHVFKGEGYPTPTDERHCVNSVSLRFGEGEGDDAGKGKAEGGK